MDKKKKEQIASYIQYQLRRQGLSQKDLADEYGCAQSAVSGVICSRAEHSGLMTLRQFIAQKLSRETWAELCAEALAAQEESA